MRMVAPVERWTARRVRTLIDETRPWPRYELLAGTLLVTPAPRPAHQAAVGELYRRLADFVERTALSASVFLSPADLELVPDTIVQPDLFVAPVAAGATVAEWRDIRTLLLAVEVVSPSTAQQDRSTKRRFFTSEAAVSEYWLVDLDARVIERWTHGDDRPTVHDSRLEWTPAGAGATLTVDLPALFGRVLGL